MPSGFLLRAGASGNEHWSDRLKLSISAFRAWIPDHLRLPGCVTWREDLKNGTDYITETRPPPEPSVEDDGDTADELYYDAIEPDEPDERSSSFRCGCCINFNLCTRPPSDTTEDLDCGELDCLPVEDEPPDGADQETDLKYYDARKQKLSSRRRTRTRSTFENFKRNLGLAVLPPVRRTRTRATWTRTARL